MGDLEEAAEVGDCCVENGSGGHSWTQLGGLPWKMALLWRCLGVLLVVLVTLDGYVPGLSQSGGLQLPRAGSAAPFVLESAKQFGGFSAQ